MITLDPAMLGQLDTPGSRSADQPRAGSPPTSGQLAKAADGRPYARLTRLERLRLDGAADEGEEPAVAHGGRGDDSDDEPEADPDQALTGSYGSAAAPAKGVKEKHKMRGKNSAMKRYLRKQKQNVIDPNAVSTACGVYECRLCSSKCSTSSLCAPSLRVRRTREQPRLSAMRASPPACLPRRSTTLRSPTSARSAAGVPRRSSLQSYNLILCAARHLLLIK